MIFYEKRVGLGEELDVLILMVFYGDVGSGVVIDDYCVFLDGVSGVIKDVSIMLLVDEINYGFCFVG